MLIYCLIFYFFLFFRLQGDAEWARMSEQERQRLIMKKRLEQKRLLREGKFDEAAKLLGDGFKTETSLKNLMGENRQKYFL